MGRGAETLPFDWIRTRLEGIQRLVDTNFAEFFDWNSKHAVPGYNFVYRGFYHSFWNDNPSSPDMHQKYLRRIERFNKIDARSKPVLFVRAVATSDELLHVQDLSRKLQARFGPLAHLLVLVDYQRTTQGAAFLQGHPQLMIQFLKPEVQYENDGGPYKEAVRKALDWVVGRGGEKSIIFQSPQHLADAANKTRWGLNPLSGVDPFEDAPCKPLSPECVKPSPGLIAAKGGGGGAAPQAGVQQQQQQYVSGSAVSSRPQPPPQQPLLQQQFPQQQPPQQQQLPQQQLPQQQVPQQQLPQQQLPQQQVPQQQLPQQQLPQQQVPQQQLPQQQLPQQQLPQQQLPQQQLSQQQQLPQQHSQLAEGVQQAPVAAISRPIDRTAASFQPPLVVLPGASASFQPPFVAAPGPRTSSPSSYVAAPWGNFQFQGTQPAGIVAGPSPMAVVGGLGWQGAPSSAQHLLQQPQANWVPMAMHA